MEFHRELSGSSLGYLPGSRTSSKILRDLVNRDGAAWRAAYVYYGGMIYRWCRRNGCRPEVAEEIAQETLTRAVRHLPDFELRSHIGGFRAYLREIARNLRVDELRSSVPVIGTRDSSFHWQGASPVDDHESMDEFVDDLEKFILTHTSLKPATVAHFIEHVIVGRSPAEIARNANPPLAADTVYRHIVRTAEALRRKFGDTPPDGFAEMFRD